MKMLLAVLTLLLYSTSLYADYSVKTIKFLDIAKLKYNAAGPMLVTTDDYRNQIYVVNTLSSAISIIEGKSDKVRNIPIGGRGLQHLKKECFTYSQKSGKLYLIGQNAFFIIDPKTRQSQTIKTGKQFESVAVDEESENVFLTGRESSKLGFYNAKLNEFKLVDWLTKEEKLQNQNQTPPPAVRKIIALNDPKNNVIAIDGYTSTIYRFNAIDGKFIKSRDIPLKNKDGRWHLAGYDWKTKQIYLVTETKKRQVLEAGKIDIFGENDIVVKLPEGFTEPVGITYNIKRKEVYVTYDNNPSLHVIEFNPDKIQEIKIPSYGNDAVALNEDFDELYIGSWAHGEIEVIDLKKREFIHKIENLGIIPHMFAMTYNKYTRSIYFPIGASAVNGTFGASITKVDVKTEKVKKIYTAWSPIDLIEVPERNSFFIFNNEDQFAEVKYGGSYKQYQLPVSFPITTITNSNNDIYLSYGPHQSYWPVVYIWGARNGVLSIGKDNLKFFDRRIPRQAMDMLIDDNGELYLQQNNWGKEPIIINKLIDGIRNLEIKKRITLSDTVQRETTQLIMKYDETTKNIYLINQAENDENNSSLIVINSETDKEIKNIEIEKIPTALEFTDDYIYVANFGSNSVSMINKKTWEVFNIKAGINPLRLVKCNNSIYVANCGSNDLLKVELPRMNRPQSGYKVPIEAKIDNIFNWKDKIILTLYDDNDCFIYEFDPKKRKYEKILNKKYPYGEINYNSGNAAFYMKGVFGDVVKSISKGAEAKNGSFWIIDFLSGRLYIINEVK